MGILLKPPRWPTSGLRMSTDSTLVSPLSSPCLSVSPHEPHQHHVVLTTECGHNTSRPFLKCNEETTGSTPKLPCDPSIRYTRGKRSLSSTFFHLWSLLLSGRYIGRCFGSSNFLRVVFPAYLRPQSLSSVAVLLLTVASSVPFSGIFCLPTSFPPLFSRRFAGLAFYPCIPKDVRGLCTTDISGVLHLITWYNDLSQR